MTITTQHIIHDIPEPIQLEPGVMHVANISEESPRYLLDPQTMETFAMDICGTRYYRVYGTTNKWVKVCAP